LKPVTKARGGDQEVEVADRLPLLPKSSALSTEDPADVLVERKDRYASQEAPTHRLAPPRVFRVIDTLVQVGERDDADSQASGAHLNGAAE
jgi:hypothetical protein